MPVLRRPPGILALVPLSFMLINKNFGFFSVEFSYFSILLPYFPSYFQRECCPCTEELLVFAYLAIGVLINSDIKLIEFPLTL